MPKRARLNATNELHGKHPLGGKKKRKTEITFEVPSKRDASLSLPALKQKAKIEKYLKKKVFALYPV